MRRILIVVDEKMIGGVNLLLEDLLNGCSTKNKIDLLVLHNHGDCFKELKNVSIIYGTPFFECIDLSIKEVLKSHSVKKIMKKIRLVFFMKTGLITKVLKMERKKMSLEHYDTEICFKSGFCSIFTSISDSDFKVSWVHENYINNDPTSKYHKLFEKIFQKINLFVAPTIDVIQSFQKKYPNTNCIQIENYINEEKIKKSIIPIEKEAPLELVTVGRLHPVKGYSRLLDVLNKLKQEGLWKNVHLSFVGDGVERRILEQKVKDYALSSTVTFVGAQKNPFPYVARSDLFILSSYSEGYGNVLIESMILNVPILATKVNSLNQFIEEHQYGFNVENTENGLYTGLKEILQNPNCIKEKKENLKHFVYNGKEIIEKFENLMEGFYDESKK